MSGINNTQGLMPYFDQQLATNNSGSMPNLSQIKALLSMNGYAFRIANFYIHYGLLKGRKFKEIEGLPNDIDLDYEMNSYYNTSGLWQKVEQLGTYNSAFGYSGIVMVDEDNPVSEALSLEDKLNKEIFFNVVDPLALRPTYITTNPNEIEYQNSRFYRLNGVDIHTSRLQLLTSGIPFYLIFNNASMSFTGFSVVSRLFSELIILEMIKRQLGVLIPKIGTPIVSGLSTSPAYNSASGNLLDLKAKLNIMGYDNALLLNSEESATILEGLGADKLIEVFRFIIDIIGGEVGIQSNFLRMEQADGGLGSTGELIMKQHSDGIIAYQKNTIDTILKKLDKFVFLKVLAANSKDNKEALSLYAKYSEELRYDWELINVPSDTEKSQINTQEVQNIQTITDSLASAPSKKIRELRLAEYQKLGYFPYAKVEDFEPDDKQPMVEQQNPPQEAAGRSAPRSEDESSKLTDSSTRQEQKSKRLGGAARAVRKAKLQTLNEEQVKKLLRKADELEPSDLGVIFELWVEGSWEGITKVEILNNKSIQQGVSPEAKQEAEAELDKVINSYRIRLEEAGQPLINYYHNTIRTGKELDRIKEQNIISRAINRQQEIMRVLEQPEQLQIRFGKLVETMGRSNPLRLVLDPKQLGTMTAREQEIVAQMIENNVALIKSLGRDYTADIIEKSRETLAKGSGLAEYNKEIKELQQASKSRVDFIARDQTAKLQNAIDYAMATSLEPEGFIWHSVGDAHTSGKPGGLYPDADPSHWDRNNKFFTMRDLDAGRIELPGTRPNCRCWAEYKY